MNDFDSPRHLNLFSLLPTLMIGLILVGHIMFGATAIFPEWRTHQELSNDLAAAQKLLAEMTSQNEQTNLTVLSAQVERAQQEIDDASNLFISDVQADQWLDALYQAARQAGVTIFDLQSPAPDPIEVEVYHTRLFHIQAEGPVLQLMNFVISIRQASAPSVIISNLNLTEVNERPVLAMDMTLHASSYADGIVLENLPVFPTLVVQTPPPPTPEAAAAPEITGAPQTNPVVVAEAAPEIVVPDNACPGAPPTFFKIGDTVVVDFRTTGRLNILSDARVSGANITVVAKANEGDRLQITAGPVCGQWNNANLWYWQVEYQGIQGWAAEGTSDSQWMCPLDNPECA